MFIMMPPLGMCFIHGQLTAMSILLCVAAENVNVGRIYGVIALLSVLCFIASAVSIGVKKLHNLQKTNNIAQIALIIDAIVCIVAISIDVVRFYLLHAFDAVDEWSKLNPFLMASVWWTALIVAVIVFYKLKHEKSKIRLLVAFFMLTTIATFIVVFGVLQCADSMIFMTEYCAVFCFVEDVILILLLTMRKKEMNVAGQGAVLCPDEKQLSDGTN